MGMHEEQVEQLSLEARKNLSDAITGIVLDVSQASGAIVALSSMMQEYSAYKNRSHESACHIESGMWLCGELGNHQQVLLERLEIALNRPDLLKGPESLLADRPGFSDSLSVAARSVSPEGI